MQQEPPRRVRRPKRELRDGRHPGVPTAVQVALNICAPHRTPGSPSPRQSSSGTGTTRDWPSPRYRVGDGDRVLRSYSTALGVGLGCGRVVGAPAVVRGPVVSEDGVGGTVGVRRGVLRYRWRKVMGVTTRLVKDGGCCGTVGVRQLVARLCR